MNNQEAIKSMRNLDDVISITVSEHESVKLAIEALEKQIPKKPKNIRNIIFTDSIKIYFSAGECPSCGEYVDTDDNRYVCSRSGCYQAIDWGVEE